MWSLSAGVGGAENEGASAFAKRPASPSTTYTQATMDKPSVVPQPQPQLQPPEKFFFAVY